MEDPARLGTSIRPDGRTLAWSEWGPADGRPVLLFPGAATSRWLGLAEGVPDALRVRLISVDRPGLGASDPAPGRSLLDWADDVRALGLDRPAAIAYSQGAPFGLACAHRGVISALAVVAGTDELAAPEVADRLRPDVRKLVQLPEAEAREAFAGVANPDTMIEMVLSMSSDADRAIYTEPSFAAAYRRALTEAFVQGTDGYVTDTLLSMTRWPFDPAEIRVPVTLWYGARDTSPVHSPDFGASLARRIPGAARHLLPDEGGALLWTRGCDIVSGL
ncbi:alpha/beta hydrolase [Cryptosporangium japonicum]|uniref:Alpha/beta hydrolase n=1 Tax=Cryptosporangium japonicum TaxID=80872 RepID=A0ABN0U533_9ACTN